MMTYNPFPKIAQPPPEVPKKFGVKGVRLKMNGIQKTIHMLSLNYNGHQPDNQFYLPPS
jgi:hypothetical protein